MESSGALQTFTEPEPVAEGARVTAAAVTPTLSALPLDCGVKSALLITLERSASGFGMKISEDCRVLSHSGPNGAAAQAAGVVAGMDILGIQGVAVWMANCNVMSNQVDST